MAKSHSPIRKAGRYRWTICALLFAATTINYMDRQILGILAPVLEREIGWTEIQYGHIVTVFQAAYALGMLLCGRMIDRIGIRRGYPISVALWSLAAVAHGWAHSVLGFSLARFSLGLAEAGNFPAAVKTVAECFPQKDRALANGIFNSGTNVGAILAPLLVPWLTVRYGWSAAFILLGFSGFVWLFFWFFLYRPPTAVPDPSVAALADCGKEPNEPVQADLSWRRLLGYRQTWAYIAGFALSAPIWWFYLYWLPKYFHKTYSLDLSQLGIPLVAIYAMTCVGSIGGGWLSSFLLRRNWSLNASRKTAMLACALCVMPIALSESASSLWMATGLIGLAAAAHQGWAANLFAMAADLFPKQVVASVVGLGGMAGALAAMAFSQSTGWILQTYGSYRILFLAAPFAYLTALGLIQWLAPKLEPARMTGP